MIDFKQKEKLFSALGSETRLEIVDYLLKNEKNNCICHLSAYLKKDQSTTFRHIEILERAGIIETEKCGKFLFCKIKDKNKIKKLIE